MTPKRDASRQKPPPPDLSDFPGIAIRGTKTLHRCHQTENGCWYFASAAAHGKGGRWDLPAPDGTCYAADTAEGALMEAVGVDLHDFGFVTETALRARQITEIRLPAATRAANLTAKTISQHGVTSELTGAVPYTLTQDWAKAFKAAGFGGVRYGLRFRPNTKGLGIFGPSGPDESLPTGTETPAIDIARMLGLPIEPTPTLGELDVLEPPT